MFVMQMIAEIMALNATKLMMLSSCEQFPHLNVLKHFAKVRLFCTIKHINKCKEKHHTII